MDYYKVNYNKLWNLPQIRFSILLLIIIIFSTYLFILSLFINVYDTFNGYGIYKDKTVILQVNSKLSDILANNIEIKFNNRKITCNKIEYKDYEFVNNEILQIVYLYIDESFIDNEIGTIKINYNEQRLIKYVLKLFK